jgi:hypothetical protein
MLKHFDSAQCDNRLLWTLHHLNALIINSIRRPPESRTCGKGSNEQSVIGSGVEGQ